MLENRTDDRTRNRVACEMDDETRNRVACETWTTRQGTELRARPGGRDKIADWESDTCDGDKVIQKYGRGTDMDERE